MEHNNVEPKKKPNLIEKITYFICGFFLSLLIITIILKFVPNLWGGVAGATLTAALGTFSFKKYQNDTMKKITSIGMMSAVGFLIAATILVFLTIQLAFQGISN